MLGSAVRGAGIPPQLTQALLVDQPRHR